MSWIATRTLPDDRFIGIYPLTFGRARPSAGSGVRPPMICKTCNTPHGEVDMATSDKKPPTWVCANGHKQPWGEDVRPAWIEAAARELLGHSPCTQDIFGDVPQAAQIIEKHWRLAR